MKGKLTPKKRAFVEAIIGPEKTALLEAGKALPPPKLPRYSWMKATTKATEPRDEPALERMVGKIFGV